MTKVKICGITNLEDALHAVECGADMIGFNFYDKSPRLVTPYSALEIAKNLPEKIWKVGVFVNMESYRIDEYVSLIGLDSIQIHGDEDSDFISELRTETKARIIKAIRIGHSMIDLDVANNSADFFLLDKLSDGQYGGSGQSFDWSMVKGFENASTTFILAGGLNPDNVTDA